MILVTGATGFLGSELVRQLLLEGKPVRALKRETSVIPAILSDSSNLEWVNGDILDEYSLNEALKGISHVYHCAALVSFRKADKKKLIRVNVEGTASLVNICMQNSIQKLVHCSSVAAVGENKTGDPSAEGDQWIFDKKQSTYALSKYEGEMEVFRGIAEGLNAVIVNPSIIIGKNTGGKGSGQLFEAVKNGLKFYPQGSCGIVDVEDVARIMIRLMESENATGRFIINSENISYRELLTGIALAYGLPAPAIKLSPWMLKAGFLASSVAKLFTGKDVGITTEIANSAFKVSRYSNDKISKALNFHFKPINQSIQEIASVIHLNNNHQTLEKILHH